MVNQEELADDRVKAWCAQLKTEGFFAGVAGAAAAPAPAAAPAAASISDALTDLIEPEVSVEPAVMSEVTKVAGDEAAKYPGWTPYRSDVLGQTLWVKEGDAAKSFYTFHTKAK